MVFFLKSCTSWLYCYIFNPFFVINPALQMQLKHSAIICLHTDWILNREVDMIDLLDTCRLYQSHLHTGAGYWFPSVVFTFQQCVQIHLNAWCVQDEAAAWTSSELSELGSYSWKIRLVVNRFLLFQPIGVLFCLLYPLSQHRRRFSCVLTWFFGHYMLPAWL